MSPEFRTNGNTEARSPEWRRHAAAGFAGWRLRVDGLVEAPAAFSLAELRAMPARSQITRHDCVEGWSAIGKWTGVPLAEVLDRVRLRPEARFIVLHCADDFATGLQRLPYYESIDLVDAFHPQTILAYGMNDTTLPIGHGAPIRLRVERQLGYKHAKFVMRVEAVASLAAIGQGKGGFWEDQRLRLVRRHLIRPAAPAPRSRRAPMTAPGRRAAGRRLPGSSRAGHGTPSTVTWPSSWSKATTTASRPSTCSARG